MGIKVDLTGIDLASLIEQETPTRLGKPYGSGIKRTRKGACPWCGGTDRFAVVDSDPPHFYCGIHKGQGCGKHGDAIELLKQWHNISFMDACTRLGVKPVKDGLFADTARRIGKLHLNIDPKPCDDWRMVADYFLARFQDWLWKDSGQEGIAELRLRGFSDETIRQCGYGYNPKTVFDSDTARWGIADPEVKAVWLPRGIVIPWFVGEDLWKLNIRRPSADMEDDEKRTGYKSNKYVNVKGGSNPLYRVDTIQPGKPLVLFEGEFNADILAQVLAEAGITDIAVLATGSTGKGRADNWLMKVAKATPILISFDPDGAGAQAAKEYWSKVLPQALIWPSIGGDLNDMYLASKDVVKWLKRGLKLAGAELAVHAPELSSAPVESYAPTPFRSEDQSLHAVDDIGLAVFGEGCTLTLIPKGYTLDQRIADLRKNVADESDLANDSATWQRIRAARAHVSMPRWLTKGTDEWNKEVARRGLDEMIGCRKAAMQEVGR